MIINPNRSIERNAYLLLGYCRCFTLCCAVPGFWSNISVSKNEARACHPER